MTCRAQADPSRDRHDDPPERIPCGKFYHVFYDAEPYCSSQCNKPEPVTRVQV